MLQYFGFFYHTLMRGNPEEGDRGLRRIALLGTGFSLGRSGLLANY